MRKKRVAVAVAAVAAVVGLGVWLVLPPREPVYQGKTLTELAAGVDDKISPFQEAVQAVGTNAIPVLLKLLRAHDSPLKLRLLELAGKQHLFKVHHTDAKYLNEAGLVGFDQLGKRAAPAVPALIRIYEEKISPSSQEATASSLGNIGPDAQTAIPALLQETASTNNGIRETAFFALAFIRENPDVLVPLFIKGLRDQSPRIQNWSVWGLDNFGLAAKPAVPALADYLQKGAMRAPRVFAPNASTNPKTWAMALDVLKKIDSAATDKLADEWLKDAQGN